jgi:hypothetical protein
MVNVALVPEANNQSLVEYCVGRANSSCVCPGIAQCFAIFGRRQSFMTCTHVSPGATAQNMTDTFQYLREIGGNWATSWHIVGPFANHFSDSRAIWKSAQNIRDAFKAELGDNGADYWIFDVSKQ